MLRVKPSNNIFQPAKNVVNIFGFTYSQVIKSYSEESKLENLKEEWAQKILSSLNVNLEVVGLPSEEKSLLMVGNHISYLDIPLLMSTAKNLSFVAKYELSRWPIFGQAAKKANTVFVKRDNQHSRLSVRSQVADEVKSGKRVVIFPSGTTSMSECKDWKRGAFSIAQAANAFVQPFRISYKQLRAVAYIDDDFFPVHLFNLSKYKNIDAKIEFHEPVKISDPIRDSEYWQNWARGFKNEKRN